MQKRQLLKGLHDADEGVEVERRDRADRIDPAPDARQAIAVERNEGNGQDRERYDSDDVRRHESRRRKKEAGHAGQYRGCQKNSGPPFERLACKRADENDDARENSDKTQDNMHE
ncbi:MAG: hypothetical protein JOZ40_20395, partial [Methylobacteriaceae bacterium]|nr:hypothetical protein [Methylobacteriaceae bacterium]